jgi:hypothetical protein
MTAPTDNKGLFKLIKRLVIFAFVQAFMNRDKRK